MRPRCPVLDSEGDSLAMPIVAQVAGGLAVEGVNAQAPLLGHVDQGQVLQPVGYLRIGPGEAASSRNTAIP